MVLASPLIANNGSIQSLGGLGAAASTSGLAAGGGGGGGGGVIFLIRGTRTGNTPVVTGGAGGSGAGGGATGTTGGTGTLVEVQN
jgi:hypothetical protein